jgi:hypothetical protein
MNKLVSSPLARLPKRSYRVGLLGLLAVALVFGAFSFAPTAHAASQTAARAEHCQIVLAKLQPGETTSRILSQQCSTQPVATSNERPPVIRADCPFGSTHLMRWWADIYYSGAYTDICGWSGPCDSSGYGISYVGNAWNDRISSFQVFNHCYYTRAYVNANYGGDCRAYAGDTDWVGSYMNDKISSFRIASAQYHC